MAKFFGKIGYRITQETKPGIWEVVIIEKEYFGDVIRLSIRSQTSDKVVDDIVVSNVISIVSDDFAIENIQNLLWVEWQGIKWKVSVMEIGYPRLSLTLGGVYNG